MDQEMTPLVVQKIIGRVSKGYYPSLVSSYSMEDLWQEGWIVWLELKDAKKWGADNHRARFFQTSFRNHLNNLCRRTKLEIKPFAQQELLSGNGGPLKVSLQWAPELIVDIGEAIATVLEAHKKPTNANVCKELNCSSAHTNVLVTFKKYLTGDNTYGEKVTY